MAYFNRLGSSFSGFWKNPAMLGVMIMDFIAKTVIGSAFVILDIFLLSKINPLAMQAITDTYSQFMTVAVTGTGTFTMNWTPFLDPTTLAVMIPLILLQFLLIVYVNTFFLSGFFGMAKNYTQDGKTKISEFMPSVKRYWHGMFWLTFARNVLMVVIFTPFLLAFSSYMGTATDLISTGQIVFIVVTAIFLVLMLIMVSLALFYAEAAIVFEDLNAMPAIKRSWNVMKQNFGVTILTGLGVLVLFFLSDVLVKLLMLPFDMIVENTLGNETWLLIQNIASWCFNVVAISASIITGLFILLTYREIVGKSRIVKAAPEKSTGKTVDKKAAAKPAPVHKKAVSHKK